ncbi:MAG: LysR family transcriptional regulator [Tateyamaria sp.]|uniref:LysR family transcriptional regulator n=1 Tax=Tateyamaria sp. TaxID=1929288 RepID=UPI0032950696
MNFATLDLNLLRVLDAILHEGSTVKAGNRLGLSQSAVSNALNRLRHSLEDELFFRQGNTLIPTDYAASVKDDLRGYLSELEVLLARSDFEPSTARGVFRISGGDYFSEMLIPRLSALLAETAPKVLLQQVAWEPVDHLRMLENEEADLGLGPLLTNVDELPPWIMCQHLFDSSFVGIAAKQNPLVSDIPDYGELSIDRYFAASHVMFSVSGEIESFEDGVIKRLGKKRHIALTVPTFHAVLRAISESPYLAIVPVSLASRVAEQYGLRMFSLPFHLDGIPVFATWHQRSDRTPLANWLRDQAFGIVEPLGDESSYRP